MNNLYHSREDEKRRGGFSMKRIMVLMLLLVFAGGLFGQLLLFEGFDDATITNFPEGWTFVEPGAAGILWWGFSVGHNSPGALRTCFDFSLTSPEVEDVPAGSTLKFSYQLHGFMDWMTPTLAGREVQLWVNDELFHTFDEIVETWTVFSIPLTGITGDVVVEWKGIGGPRSMAPAFHLDSVVLHGPDGYDPSIYDGPTFSLPFHENFAWGSNASVRWWRNATSASTITLNTIGNGTLSPFIGPITSTSFLDLQFSIQSGATHMPITNQVLQIKVGDVVLHEFNSETTPQHNGRRFLRLPLVQFAGENIRFEFVVTTGGENFLFMMFNFNVYNALDYDLAIHTFGRAPTSVGQPYLENIGVDTGYTVSVTNVGLQTAMGYTVRLVRTSNDGDIVLASVPGVSLATGATHTFTIPWAPDFVSNSIRVQAIIDWSLDQLETNNRSFEKEVVILERAMVQVGTVSGTNHHLPVWTGNFFSYTQNIYYPSEINRQGYITSIFYNWNGGGSSGAYNEWTVYMLHSDIMAFTTTLAANWIPIGDFTQVFKGQVPLTTTAGWIEIELDTPFYYNNIDNLVIAIHDDKPTWFSGSFFCTPNLATVRARRLGTADPIDPVNPGNATSTNNTIANIRMQFVVEDDNPMNTVLSSFTAMVTAGFDVSVQWATSSENNMLGFHVYRQVVGEGSQDIVLVSDNLIRATNTSTAQRYSFLDEHVVVWGGIYLLATIVKK